MSVASNASERQELGQSASRKRESELSGGSSKPFYVTQATVSHYKTTVSSRNDRDQNHSVLAEGEVDVSAENPDFWSDFKKEIRVLPLDERKKAMDLTFADHGEFLSFPSGVRTKALEEIGGSKYTEDVPTKLLAAADEIWSKKVVKE